MSETVSKAFTYFTEDHAASMRLRDYFAASAIQGILSSSLIDGNANVWQMARDAYKVADAMIEVRNEE
jgi:hypothetical protein